MNVIEYGQSKMDNTEKLATSKGCTKLYAANTYNVNKTTGGTDKQLEVKDKPNIVFVNHI